jgi:hypothetical protein
MIENPANAKNLLRNCLNSVSKTIHNLFLRLLLLITPHLMALSRGWRENLLQSLE